MGKLIISVSLLFLLISPFVESIAWWSSLAQLSLHHNGNGGGGGGGAGGREPKFPPEESLNDGQRNSMVYIDPLVCTRLEGLSEGQIKICELFTDHIPAVGEGARAAIEECQWQFSNNKWNCSKPPSSNYIGPSHQYGTREAAFTYAILSAGVSQQVGRTCKMGLLRSCGCSTAKKPTNIANEWAWGGCGDNAEYGYDFSKNFIDIREKEHDHRPGSQEFGRTLMNRWNNEVGRKLVKRMTKPICKCHGVSGACNIKTCWNQMPDMRTMGETLREKYQHAMRVKTNQRGNLQLVDWRHLRKRSGRARRRDKGDSKYDAYYNRRPQRLRKSIRQTDLVYMDDSPDYCKVNQTLGLMGTRGRECRLYLNPEQQNRQMELCDSLCCGRGHRPVQMTVTRKCNCKFQWCCKVVCQQCVHRIITNVCN